MLGYDERRYTLLFPANKLPQLTLDLCAQPQAGLFQFQVFKENINNLIGMMMGDSIALIG